MAQIQQYLDTIRTAESGENVRDAIVQALDKIHGDNPVTVTQRTAKMPQSGDLIINAEGGTAYDQVTVHPADGSKGAMTLTELTATENREYIPDDNEYYSKVTVDVPQLNNDIMEDVFEVTENNVTIYAAEEGFDGFSAIHVNISNIPVGGSFEVQFYDTDGVTLLQTQLVPAYGSAHFDPRDGYPVDPAGKSFVGWNPDPSNVTKNMKCYPRFVDQSVAVGEIPDGWEVICARNGAGYPIGSYKFLAYGATYNKSELEPIFPTTITDETWTFETRALMVKVAEGEDGSTSTWLGLADGTTLYGSGGTNAYPWPGRYAANGWISQGDKFLRGFYNGPFFDHMADIFKQHIKPVTKYTVEGNILYPSVDKIWIPSTKEIFSDGIIYDEDPNDPTKHRYYDMGLFSSSSYLTEEAYEAAKQNSVYLRINTCPVNYITNLEIRNKLRAYYSGSGGSYIALRDSDGGSNGPICQSNWLGFELARRDPMPALYWGFCL